MKMEFNERELADFWIRRQQYPSIEKAAFAIIIPSASTYVCETAFSLLFIIKNKGKLCLSVQALANLRTATSNIISDTDLMCKNMQSHPY
jgi:hypothetical protein